MDPVWIAYWGIFLTGFVMGFVLCAILVAR